MQPKSIYWLKPCDFECALLQSTQNGKPVLLDFHDPDCAGSQQLECKVYTDPEIIEAVTRHVIPVRVVTKEWDTPSTAIIWSYISISSAVVQVLSSEGTACHYWRGVPRLTVLSARQIAKGERRVHLDSSASVAPEMFLAQLWLGLGKVALKQNRYERARQLFQEALGICSGDSEIMAEASYWASIARPKTRPLAVTSEAYVSCPSCQER